MLTNFKQKNLFISAFFKEKARHLHTSLKNSISEILKLGKIKFFIIGKLGKMKYEEIRKLLGKFRKL